MATLFGEVSLDRRAWFVSRQWRLDSAVDEWLSSFRYGPQLYVPTNGIAKGHPANL